MVPEDVYTARKARLTERLRQLGIDAVVIYADREHCANFKYYTGVDPRFEEALLVIHSDDRVFLALGNECYALVDTSAISFRISSSAFFFSSRASASACFRISWARSRAFPSIRAPRRSASRAAWLII